MDIKIILDKPEFFPGDYLSGYITLKPQNKTSIKNIQMTFNLIEDWNHLRPDCKYETANNTQSLSVFNISLDHLKNSKDSTIDLEPKEYEFIFKEKLPDYLLPSFEFPQNKFRAFLRYNLSAKVKGIKENYNSSNFVKINAIPKKEDNLNIKASQLIKKWGVFSKGETELNANYYTKNYKLSDSIPVEIEIDNTKSKAKVKECKLKLFRKIIFRDKELFSDKYFQEDKLIREVFKAPVNKKEKKKFNFSIDLNKIVYKDFNYQGLTNPYKDKYSYMDLLPSLDGIILSCEYKLEIILKFDVNIKKEERPKVVLPIYIVHKLDDDHVKKAIEEAEQKKEKELVEGFEVIDEDDEKDNKNQKNNNNQNMKEEINLENKIQQNNDGGVNYINNQNQPIYQNKPYPNQPVYQNNNQSMYPNQPYFQNQPPNPINQNQPFYQNQNQPMYPDLNKIEDDDLDLPSRESLYREYENRDKNKNENNDNNDVKNNQKINDINKINDNDEFDDIIDIEEYNDEKAFTNSLSQNNNNSNNNNNYFNNNCNYRNNNFSNNKNKINDFLINQNKNNYIDKNTNNKSNNNSINYSSNDIKKDRNMNQFNNFNNQNPQNNNINIINNYEFPSFNDINNNMQNDNKVQNDIININDI